MQKIAVIGASSLTGNKLIEILNKHPQADVAFAFSNSFAGKKVSDVYPDANSDIEYQAFNSQLLDGCDVVFSCLPHGKSMSLLPSIASDDKLIIDLGTDFRIPADVFEKWYGLEHEAKDSTPQTYGLSEVFTEDIKKSKFIANPGCYPTSVLLALAPLLKENVKLENLSIFSISGRSGAGREKAQDFEKQGENVFKYKAPYDHQHIGEMEYIGSTIGKYNFKLLSFHPHVITNLFQGMHTTVVAQCDIQSIEKIATVFKEYYENQPFVKISYIDQSPSPLRGEGWGGGEKNHPPLNPLPLREGKRLDLKSVVNTNDCLLGLNYDKAAKRLCIISVIDNLVKGASGQAVQNMNLALGWDQSLGLMGTLLAM